jgi:DNA-binding beta-propeller fold protein YncE
MKQQVCRLLWGHRLLGSFLGLIFSVVLVGAHPALAQGMIAPVRLTEGPPGQLLVSDYPARAVFVVDKQSTKILWTIDIDGTPMGVAWLDNRMYVGNEETGCVEVHEVDVTKQKAKLVDWLGGRPRKGSCQGLFNRPTDVAVDPETGQIFVLDIGDQFVKVFDSAGNYLSRFPPAAPGEQVSFVAAIAVDVTRKEVLVSDHGIPYGAVPPRILIFNYAGGYLRFISGGNVFARPQGLVTDSVGHIFVVDQYASELVILDQNEVLENNEVGVVARLGGPGELKGPSDVVLDQQSGDVFVSNTNLGRIQAYRDVGGIL